MSVNPEANSPVIVCRSYLDRGLAFVKEDIKRQKMSIAKDILNGMVPILMADILLLAKMVIL